MKILCLCQEGVNRSVTVAHQLKYLGHDVLSAGLARNAPETLELLYGWADHIITTDRSQSVPEPHGAKLTLFDLGPDGQHYRRPFNPLLLARTQALVAQHRGSLRERTAA